MNRPRLYDTEGVEVMPDENGIAEMTAGEFYRCVFAHEFVDGEMAMYVLEGTAEQVAESLAQLEAQLEGVA